MTSSFWPKLDNVTKLEIFWLKSYPQGVEFWPVKTWTLAGKSTDKSGKSLDKSGKSTDKSGKSPYTSLKNSLVSY